MGFTVYEGIPKIYDRVAAMDDIVLAEMPFPPRAAIQDNGPSVLYSAWHLKPLLNGYSGFTPGELRDARGHHAPIPAARQRAIAPRRRRDTRPAAQAPRQSRTC